jgi:hypothetical protein
VSGGQPRVLVDGIAEKFKEEDLTIPVPGSDRVNVQNKRSRNEGSCAVQLPPYLGNGKHMLAEVFADRVVKQRQIHMQDYVCIPLHVQRAVRHVIDQKDAEIQRLKALLREEDPTYKGYISKYMGVSKNGKTGWAVQHTKKKYAGTYQSEIDAAKVHDKDIIERNGLFKSLNFLNFRGAKVIQDMIKEKQDSIEYKQLYCKGSSIYRGVKTIPKRTAKGSERRIDNPKGTGRKRWWQNDDPSMSGEQWPPRKRFRAIYGNVPDGVGQGKNKNRPVVLGDFHSEEEAAYAVSEVASMLGQFGKDNPTVTWKDVAKVRKARANCTAKEISMFFSGMLEKHKKYVTKSYGRSSRQGPKRAAKKEQTVKKQKVQSGGTSIAEANSSGPVPWQPINPVIKENGLPKQSRKATFAETVNIPIGVLETVV